MLSVFCFQTFLTKKENLSSLFCCSLDVEVSDYTHKISSSGMFLLHDFSLGSLKALYSAEVCKFKGCMQCIALESTE